MEIEETLRDLGIALAVGLLCVPIARVLRLPVMVVLVAGGIVAGPSLLGLLEIPIDATGPGLLFTLGVALILFHGGMGISVRVLSRTAIGLLILSIPGVLVTAGIMAVVIAPLFGVPFEVGLLAGATIAATDPAILVPLFQRLGLRPRVAQTVIAESAVNDPMATILALAVAGVVASGAFSGGAAVADFALSVGVGLGIGVVAGALIALLLSTSRLGVLRESPAAVLLALVTLAYFASETVGGSPYLAAFVAGLIVGNKDLIRVDHDQRQERLLHDVTGEAVDVVVLLIFVMLGLTLDLGGMADYLLPGLAAMGVFILIARPFTVALCLLPDRRARWTRQEIAFIAWCRETGAVPVAIAGLLIAEDVPGAEVVAAIVAFAVVSTLLLQATTAGAVARRLGLLDGPRPDPD